MQKKLSEKVKKNLLDLGYSKYLQYYNTIIIITFSYIIAVGIAFLTKSIDYREKGQLYLIATVSIAFLGILVILMLNFKRHQESIKQEMRNLKI